MKHLPSLLLTASLLLLFGVAGAAESRPLNLTDLALLGAAAGLGALSRRLEPVEIL